MGFSYAVIKKYGEDSGGYQAALVTYYGFLSLFPLLLVGTSVLQILLYSYPNIRDSVIRYATQYFPILGDQLEANVRGLDGTGFAIAIGLLLTLWGAKGVADAFQASLNHIWQVPMVRRPGFPKNSIKSLAIIVIGGLGLIGASFLSGLAVSINESILLTIISILVSVVILFGIFWFLFKIALAGSAKVGSNALISSAITAAAGVQILQIIGGFLVTNELSKLKDLYGAFAITLGLLFWIYLQAKVVMYAAEVGAVYDKKLWPRSLDQNQLTDADKQVYSKHAKKERFVIPEKIGVKFKEKR